MTRCVLVKCPGVWSQINRGGQAVESVQTHGVASRPQAPNPLSEAAPVMTQTASGGSRPGAAGCASPRPGGDWFPGVTSLAPRRAASPSPRESRGLRCGMATEPGGAVPRLPEPALAPETWPGVPAR